MAKKNHIIILVSVLVTVLLVAMGTAAVLGRINKKEPVTATSSENEKTAEDDPFKAVIDESKNTAASAIEKEAADLMESDPAKAKEKYEAARQTYFEAGNLPKMSEMDANAQTATLLIQQKSEQQSP